MLMTRQRGVLAVSAVVAFAAQVWILDVDVGLAIGITVVYTVIAVVVMYFKSQSASEAGNS